MAAWTAAIVERSRLRFRLIALACYGVHIVAAFHGSYGWSLEAAWSHTAAQTEALTGWRSGVGLPVNFAFFALLLADLRWRWRFVDFVIVFMIINGAIVFADGPVRWFGVVLVVIVAAAWIRDGVRGR